MTSINTNILYTATAMVRSGWFRTDNYSANEANVAFRLSTLATGGHNGLPSQWFNAGIYSHSRTRLNRRGSRFLIQTVHLRMSRTLSHNLWRRQRIEDFEYSSDPI
jgi:hypothetical protein